MVLVLHDLRARVAEQSAFATRSILMYGCAAPFFGMRRYLEGIRRSAACGALRVDVGGSVVYGWVCRLQDLLAIVAFVVLADKSILSVDA